MTRVAVVGAGRFGAEHLAAYRAVPGAELVGVLDTDPARARRVADEHSTVAYADLDALLAARPEAVSLVVPAAARGDLVRSLVANGAAVLIEKPLAADVAVADALAAELGGLPVLCGHVVRFAEPYVRARGAVAGPERITASRIRDAAHATAYPGEDVVGLTMVHDLDVLGWLAGPRSWRVRASGVRGTDGRWIEAAAELRSAGLAATVEAAWRGDAASDRLTVHGAGATAEVGIGDGGDVYGAALVAELAHFLDCARDRRPSEIIGLESAASAVRLVAAVRAALAGGGEIDVRT